MEMLSAFTDVLHVSNLTQPAHFAAILQKHDMLNDQEVASVLKKLEGYRMSIGVKKLLDLMDMIKQTKENRAAKFLAKLEDEGFITPNYWEFSSLAEIQDIPPKFYLASITILVNFTYANIRR